MMYAINKYCKMFDILAGSPFVSALFWFLYLLLSAVCLHLRNSIHEVIHA